MTTTQLILVIAVATAIVAALAASRRGPRITQITRTVRKDNDEPKDGPDA